MTAQLDPNPSYSSFSFTLPCALTALTTVNAATNRSMAASSTNRAFHTPSRSDCAQGPSPASAALNEKTRCVICERRKASRTKNVYQ